MQTATQGVALRRMFNEAADLKSLSDEGKPLLYYSSCRSCLTVIGSSRSASVMCREMRVPLLFTSKNVKTRGRFGTEAMAVCAVCSLLPAGLP
jgi:hypothetical protein